MSGNVTSRGSSNVFVAKVNVSKFPSLFKEKSKPSHGGHGSNQSTKKAQLSEKHRRGNKGKKARKAHRVTKPSQKKSAADTSSAAKRFLTVLSFLAVAQRVAAPPLPKPPVRARRDEGRGEEAFAFPDSQSASVYQSGSFDSSNPAALLTSSGFTGSVPEAAFASFINSQGGSVSYDESSSSVGFTFQGYDYEFGGFQQDSSSGSYSYDPSYRDPTFHTFYTGNQSIPVMNIRIARDGRFLNFDESKAKLAEINTAIAASDISIPAGQTLSSNSANAKISLSGESVFDTAASNRYLINGADSQLHANSHGGELSFVAQDGAEAQFAAGPNLYGIDDSGVRSSQVEFAVASGSGDYCKVYGVTQDLDSLSVTSPDGSKSVNISGASNGFYRFGIKNPYEDSLRLTGQSYPFIASGGRSSFAGVSIDTSVTTQPAVNYDLKSTSGELLDSKTIPIFDEVGDPVSSVVTTSLNVIQGPDGSSYICGRYSTGTQKFGCFNIDGSASSFQFQNIDGFPSRRPGLDISGNSIIRYVDNDGNFYYQVAGEYLKIAVNGDLDRVATLPASAIRNDMIKNTVTLNSGDSVSLSSSTVTVRSSQSQITHRPNVDSYDKRFIDLADSVGLSDRVDFNLGVDRSVVISYENAEAKLSTINIQSGGVASNIQWKVFDRQQYSPYDIAGSDAKTKFNLASGQVVDPATFDATALDSDRYFVAGAASATNSVLVYDTDLQLGLQKAVSSEIVLSTTRQATTTETGTQRVTTTTTFNPTTATTTTTTTTTSPDRQTTSTNTVTADRSTTVTTTSDLTTGQQATLTTTSTTSDSGLITTTITDATTSATQTVSSTTTPTVTVSASGTITATTASSTTTLTSTSTGSQLTTSAQSTSGEVTTATTTTSTSGATTTTTTSVTTTASPTDPTINIIDVTTQSTDNGDGTTTVSTTRSTITDEVPITTTATSSSENSTQPHNTTIPGETTAPVTTTVGTPGTESPDEQSRPNPAGKTVGITIGVIIAVALLAYAEKKRRDKKRAMRIHPNMRSGQGPNDEAQQMEMANIEPDYNTGDERSSSESEEDALPILHNERGANEFVEGNRNQLQTDPLVRATDRPVDNDSSQRVGAESHNEGEVGTIMTRHGPLPKPTAADLKPRRLTKHERPLGEPPVEFPLKPPNFLPGPKINASKLPERPTQEAIKRAGQLPPLRGGAVSTQKGKAIADAMEVIGASRPPRPRTAWVGSGDRPDGAEKPGVTKLLDGNSGNRETSI